MTATASAPRRLAGVLLASGSVLVMVLSGAASSGPARTRGPGCGRDTGGRRAPVGGRRGRLGRQFGTADHLTYEFEDQTYPDLPGTVDAIFALNAAGVGPDILARATDWLASRVTESTGEPVDTNPSTPRG